MPAGAARAALAVRPDPAPRQVPAVEGLLWSLTIHLYISVSLSIVALLV